MKNAKILKTRSLIIVSILMGLLVSCNNTYNGIPTKYHTLLDNAFVKAGQNRVELQAALDQTPKNQKEGMAYLISYMPKRDLTTLTSDFLLENVTYAYKSREAFSWGAQIPDSIFFNDVLPYMSLNERRDNWRKDFFNRFSKYVEGCSDIRAAIDSLNKNIKYEVKVEYNTKREKPDQSPYESMKQGMASCSGLSILLTDAFRAVGIPSRIAGTPNWHDNRGNHNWNEVWIEGKWYFTEYYPNKLNHSWFLADAGKADSNDPKHAIYASSYKPTSTPFPLVWDSTIMYVPAFNVTKRYVQIYKDGQREAEKKRNSVQVKVFMFKNEACMQNGDNRAAVNVDVWNGKDQVGGGQTSGPLNDLNDVLVFNLKKNTSYSISYLAANGKKKSITFTTKDENMDLKLYLN